VRIGRRCSLWIEQRIPGDVGYLWVGFKPVLLVVLFYQSSMSLLESEYMEMRCTVMKMKGIKAV
jgi:hypothetical protein